MYLIPILGIKWLLVIPKTEVQYEDVNQMINNIKFYLEVVMQMPNCFYSIERPRKKESSPKVISLEDVQHIIKSTKFSENTLV